MSNKHNAEKNGKSGDGEGTGGDAGQGARTGSLPVFRSNAGGFHRLDSSKAAPIDTVQNNFHVHTKQVIIEVSRFRIYNYVIVKIEPGPKWEVRDQEGSVLGTFDSEEAAIEWVEVRLADPDLDPDDGNDNDGGPGGGPSP